LPFLCPLLVNPSPGQGCPPFPPCNQGRFFQSRASKSPCSLLRCPTCFVSVNFLESFLLAQVGPDSLMAIVFSSWPFAVLPPALGKALTPPSRSDVFLKLVSDFSFFGSPDLVPIPDVGFFWRGVFADCGFFRKKRYDVCGFCLCCQVFFSIV